MILSAHQPAYLPWLGYFDKLIRSDVFVFLDTIQYEKNSFINRNQIKTPQGPIWLTVPVRTKGHIGSTLLKTEINSSQDWRRKHLKSIYLNYKKAPRFEVCSYKLKALYDRDDIFLSDMCFRQLEFWLEEFGIHKKIVRSSHLPVRSSKSNLILDLCRYFGANRYLAGALGKNYLNEKKFDSFGVAIEYQVYLHPIYHQLYGEFIPNMGIVDFWMNTDQIGLITARDRK